MSTAEPTAADKDWATSFDRRRAVACDGFVGPSSKRMDRPRRSDQRCGTAATELAVILPVLIVLTLGCVDFGRGLYCYVLVSNGARVGVEYGATHQFTDYSRESWESLLESTVHDEMTQLSGFNAEQLSLTIETDEDSSGETRVDVTVHYPFETIVRWPGVPQSLMLWRMVSMRQVR